MIVYDGAPVTDVSSPAVAHFLKTDLRENESRKLICWFHEDLDLEIFLQFFIQQWNTAMFFLHQITVSVMTRAKITLDEKKKK